MLLSNNVSLDGNKPVLRNAPEANQRDAASVGAVNLCALTAHMMSFDAHVIFPDAWYEHRSGTTRR